MQKKSTKERMSDNQSITRERKHPTLLSDGHICVCACVYAFYRVWELANKGKYFESEIIKLDKKNL